MDNMPLEFFPNFNFQQNFPYILCHIELLAVLKTHHAISKLIFSTMLFLLLGIYHL